MSEGNKLLKKVKDHPVVPIGIGLTVAALGWGAYTYKEARASGLAKSVFFMQLRVKAQSMVVGAMTVGVAYALLRDYVFHPKGSAEVHESYQQPYSQDTHQAK